MKYQYVENYKSVLLVMMFVLFSIPLLQASAQEVTNGFATTTSETAPSSVALPIDDYCDGIKEDCATPVSISVCTRDVKSCADGSSVGRTGVDCEFTACPDGEDADVIIEDSSIAPIGETKAESIDDDDDPYGDSTLRLDPDDDGDSIGTVEIAQVNVVEKPRENFFTKIWSFFTFWFR